MPKVIYVFWDFCSFAFYIYIYNPLQVNFPEECQACARMFSCMYTSCCSSAISGDHLCCILLSLLLRHRAVDYIYGVYLGVSFTTTAPS